MKEIRISPEKFKFNKFVESMLKFQENVSDSIYAAPWIFELNDAPNYNEKGEDRDYLKELKEENKMLYFDFTNVNVGFPINCADGNVFDPNDEEEVDICFGDPETLGYLIQFKDDTFIINSALSYGGGCNFPPTIDIKLDCGLFDSLMEKFINKFII